MGTPLVGSTGPENGRGSVNGGAPWGGCAWYWGEWSETGGGGALPFNGGRVVDIGGDPREK